MTFANPTTASPLRWKKEYPCLICNTAKKKDLMDYIKTQGIDMNSLVVIMSYSLLGHRAAPPSNIILGAVFNDKEAARPSATSPRRNAIWKRFQRFYPMLRMPAGFSIFKPLIYYNDQDIRSVLKSEGIPVLSTLCKYKQYRPKRLFAQYYERMNLQFDFKEVFNFAQKALNLPEESHFTQMGGEHYLKRLYNRVLRPPAPAAFSLLWVSTAWHHGTIGRGICTHNGI